MYAAKSMIPFEQTIEVPDMNQKAVCRTHWCLEQLSVTMLDGEELDIKAVLQYQILVFATQDQELITDIKVEELDLNKLNELPGMVIYIAGDGDTLWDIGKKYYVSIEQLKEVNELVSEEISCGDKILLIKGVS